VAHGITPKGEIMKTSQCPNEVKGKIVELLDNMPGDTSYKLEKIIEYYGSAYRFCKEWDLAESAISDMRRFPERTPKRNTMAMVNAVHRLLELGDL
jgi:hypothetical protein